MRLQEIYSICQHTLESWHDLSFEEKKATGGATYYNLKNLDKVKDLLIILDSLPFFAEKVTIIKKTSNGFEQLNGVATFDSSTKKVLTETYNEIKLKLETIVDMFESIDYRQPTEGFDIKMPPGISLLDFSKCTKDLNTIFSTCPLFSKNDCSISLVAVDVGSTWLSFVIGGTAILTVLKIIAALIDKAIIIRSHHLTTKQQTEQIKSLQMGNEALESANKLHQEIGEKLLDRVGQELASEHEVNDPEDFERLKNSIKLLSDWMCKGMEIYAAVQASPEVKAVFPPLETQALSDQTIAMLSSKAESVDE